MAIVYHGRNTNDVLHMGGIWIYKWARPWGWAFGVHSFHGLSQGSVHAGLADVTESPAVRGMPIDQGWGHSWLFIHGTRCEALWPSEGNLDRQGLGLLHQRLGS